MEIAKFKGVSYPYAECYRELTLRHYQDLVSVIDKENIDLYKITEALTGADLSLIPRNKENDSKVWKIASWVITEPFDFDKANTVLYKGQQITADLGLGQMVMIYQATVGKKPESVMSRVISICIQPTVDGIKSDHDGLLFSNERALEIEKELLEMPAHEVYPIGFFSLAQVWKSGQGRSTVLRRIQNNQKRKRGKMWQSWQTSPDLSHTLEYR